MHLVFSSPVYFAFWYVCVCALLLNLQVFIPCTSFVQDFHRIYSPPLLLVLSAIHMRIFMLFSCFIPFFCLKPQRFNSTLKYLIVRMKMILSPLNFLSLPLFSQYVQASKKEEQQGLLFLLRICFRWYESVLLFHTVSVLLCVHDEKNSY